MGEVASSIGLPAIVGAIARTPQPDFDLQKTLTALAEVAQTYAGGEGIAIEQVVSGSAPFPILSIGEISGTPRRLPIIAERKELGFLAVYGAPMFGPATADRTQVIADLIALAMTRATRAKEHTLTEVEDRRFRLITAVGHNLRNTLGAASGYMQLVEMEGTLTEPQKEYVTRSRRAINAAVSLIADVLELTRADAGKLTFDREPINLNAVAREAVRKHHDEAQVKQCHVNVATLARNPIVLTDPSYVQQIVDVMIYNAIRYTPEEGSVTVTVEMRDGRRSSDPAQWICVAVTDTGGGVPEAEEVFEEVHRVEQARGNIRFRLAICRRVARLMGGDLQLETEPGVGSTFTLWLPAPASI